MPISINLLAEAQAVEEMRRKDPVKRAIWIGGFVVFVVLLASATLQFKIMAARSEVSGLQAQWKAIEKRVQEVNNHRNNTRDLEHRLAAIDQFTTNRMLWGSTLNALQYIPMDGVQLGNLRTEQTFTLNEAPRARGGDSAASSGKGNSVTEKILVTLEGKDFKEGEPVQKYKMALANHPYFESKLQKTREIQLTSLSAPQLEGSRTFRTFGMQLFFEDKERRLNE